ncbi:MAG: tetratricopeptide repeat-containing protein [Nitrospira sp.]
MPLTAFIIRPFGTKDVLLPGREDVVDGSKVRVSKLMKVNFDDVHEKLIGPALGRLHIAANTTEAIIEAGNIREDMFHLLMTADLVVADMTLHNPNVFYELGIRHAFRDKFTFLIRSEGNDDPFDLKTDRYFHYNHERPEESVDALYTAIRTTLASERTDSPVFRLLPKMRAEDRSRFIAVPRDFLEDVERAKKHRRGGDLRLLAHESSGFLWEVEALREIGRAQFELNFMGGARMTWEEIARRYPNDIEANMVLSTIYQRVSDGTRSEQSLARVSKLNIPDVNVVAEIRGLIGRNLKSQWIESWYPHLTKARQQCEPGSQELAARLRAVREWALRSPLLRKAREAYAEAFRGNLNHTYAGLSALSLLVMEVSLAREFPAVWKLMANRGEDPTATLTSRCEEIEHLTAALAYAIDAERKRLAGQNRVDFWFETMEAAFPCVTAASKEKVGQSYLEAMSWAPRYAEASMRRALALYVDLETKHPHYPTVDLQGNVKAALEVIRSEEGKKQSGNIIMCVGLRMEERWGAEKRNDHVDEPMRFLPARDMKRAKQAIQQAIEQEREKHGPILFGMAAGANGSDLLFHEVCDGLKIKTRLYLALPKDQYIGEYVAPAGAEWVEKFNGIYRNRKDECRKVSAVDSDSELIVSVLSDSMEMPRWLQGKSSYTIGKRNAVWMLQHAMVQRHIHDAEGTNVTLMVLWDRQEVEGKGSMGDLVELAQKNGIKVVHIDCSEWVKPHTGPDKAAANGTDYDYPSELELVHMP